MMEVRHVVLADEPTQEVAGKASPASVTPLTPEARHALATAPFPEVKHIPSRAMHAGRGPLTYSKSRD